MEPVWFYGLVGFWRADAPDAGARLASPNGVKVAVMEVLADHMAPVVACQSYVIVWLPAVAFTTAVAVAEPAYAMS